MLSTSRWHEFVIVCHRLGRIVQNPLLLSYGWRIWRRIWTYRMCESGCFSHRWQSTSHRGWNGAMSNKTTDLEGCCHHPRHPYLLRHLHHLLPLLPLSAHLCRRAHDPRSGWCSPGQLCHWHQKNQKWSQPIQLANFDLPIVRNLSGYGTHGPWVTICILKNRAKLEVSNYQILPILTHTNTVIIWFVGTKPLTAPCRTCR